MTSTAAAPATLVVPPVTATRHYSAAARAIPIGIILIAQALLTVRLMHNSLVANDEGRYIYAGHQLIYEFWHGGGSPYYETYFSGAPVIYPVLAAMVDHVGGLTAVRLMSLQFMLIATTALFAAGRRLFGYWPGVTAAALFAGIGLTQSLGAFATYDAMALMLMTVAAYCAARATYEDKRATRWLLLIPAALLAANATKYMTTLFDPVVILIAAMHPGDGSWQQVTRRLAGLASATLALLVLAAALAGSGYVTGAIFTTFARQSGLQQFIASRPRSPKAILAESAHWIGVVWIIGAEAFVATLVMRREPRRLLLIAGLLVAGLLVTAEGLHLHSDQSMRRHDDFGIWFTCLASGSIVEYAMAAAWKPWRFCTCAVMAAAAVMSAVYYAPQAASDYPAGPDPGLAATFSDLRPYLTNGDRYLLGGITDNAMIYADHLNIMWFDYFDDVYIKYPIPGRGGDSHGQARGRACFSVKPGCMYLEGAAGYRAAISAHWFAVVSLFGAHPLLPQDSLIEQDVERTAGYVLVTRAGGAPTWIYAPDYAHRARTAARTR